VIIDLGNGTELHAKRKTTKKRRRRKKTHSKDEPTRSYKEHHIIFIGARAAPISMIDVAVVKQMSGNILCPSEMPGSKAITNRYYYLNHVTGQHM
jgi:hypothetical protein